MIANFPDAFKTVRIFQMTANFPDDFKTIQIFSDDCQFSDVFKSVQIFADERRGYPNFPLTKLHTFGPKTPFSYIAALFDPSYGLFGPFLTLFNTKHRF